jgi:two-component system KDP operon response regulator KdpE
MSIRPRVLVCDPDRECVRALRAVLCGAEFEPDETSSGKAALDRAALRVPEGAIVELVLPDGDGVAVSRRLREWSAMPLTVLTAVRDEEQKIQARWRRAPTTT